MHTVKMLIMLSLDWLLIKESCCLFQSGKKVKYPFIILEGSFGLQQCVKECLQRKRCQIVGYHREQLRCDIGDNQEIETVSDPQFKLTFSSKLSEHQKLLGHCAHHKCEIGQICVVAKSGQLACIATDCYRDTSYTMISSGEESLCCKVYNEGRASATYTMATSRCQKDGGRLMIMDKAWKIITTSNILKPGKEYFINGFKTENGTWKYTDGRDFVLVASVEYKFKSSGELMIITNENGIITYPLDIERYGFICEI